MTDTTFEEAKRCPKCGQPGEDRNMRPAPKIRGAMIHIVYCVNKLCTWNETCWMVQVNSDGTVPPPSDHRGEPKTYVGFENHDQMARDIRANLESQRQAEMKGGHEIRNPNSR